MGKKDKTDEIKEIKIGKFRMGLKFAKLFLFTIFRTKWFIPGVSEITADELNEKINSGDIPVIVDTRDRIEFYAAEGTWRKYGHIQDSISIPIMHLTANLQKLSTYKEKDFITICPGGGMSLVAAEIMVKAGFEKVYSLKGGIDDWDRKGFPTTTDLDPKYPIDEYKPTFNQGSSKKTKEGKLTEDKYSGEIHQTVDARGLSCPGPVLNSKKAIMKLKVGQMLEILTTDPGSKTDIPAWAHVTGQELISSEENSPEEFRFIVKRLK